MARDGMSGALDFSVVAEIARINGIDDDLLNDLFDFINECESKRIEKKNKEKDK